MNDKAYVLDVKGNKVFVGDIAKVSGIDKIITPAKEEMERVMSMVGDELEVDEIDKLGKVWVTKWFRTIGKSSEAHGIALESNQIVLIRRKNGS